MSNPIRAILDRTFPGPARRRWSLDNSLGSAYRVGQRLLHNKLRLHETEVKIIADSQLYWDRVSQGNEGGNAHWRGNGMFKNDDKRWLAIGKNNLDIFHRLAGERWLAQRPRRIIDWGAGGGANAVRFGRNAERYYAVDITQASLDECCRQMVIADIHNFTPVLIRAHEPEHVRDLIRETCDLMLSTYVYELFPSKQYGYRVLRTTNHLLATGGLAFIQIKYSDLTSKTDSYRWGYARNMANMTTYRIEEFWTGAEEIGLRPRAVILEPQQPLVQDRRYAYFLLEKV